MIIGNNIPTAIEKVQIPLKGGTKIKEKMTINEGFSIQTI